jgi:hypothetical protein
MPPITEDLDENFNNSVPRSEYINFIKENPTLTVMPRELRLDLPELECDVKPQTLEPFQLQTQ